MNHAKENDLLFSTDPDPLKSKTVCIAFNCKNKKRLSNIILNNDPLPWKEKAKHIGNYLHENGTMEADSKVKRAEFIDNCMNLNNEFEFLDPHSQVRLLNLYNSHFTGSSVWRFNTDSVKQIWNSWNVNLRVIFNLPMATHCWILEQLTGSHAKKLMYSRFIKLIENLSCCEKPQVRTLLDIVKSDQRSTTGSNIRDILLETGTQISKKNTNKEQ